MYHRPISQYWIIRHKGKPANQNPAIRDRRLGQFSTGDSVKNSPALTYATYYEKILSKCNDKLAILELLLIILILFI